MKLSSSEKLAISYNLQDYSYADLCSSIGHGAEQLLSKNIAQKDSFRIALMGANSPAWIASFFAIWKVGGVVIPIDPMSSEEEISYILADSTPTAFIVSPELQSLASNSIKRADTSCTVINFDDFYPRERKVASEIQLDFFERKEQLAVIIYTSGTTGGPKGVMLSFDNLRANLDAVINKVGIFKNSDRVLALLPFHHIFPLAGSLLAPLMVGAQVVIPSELSSEHIIDCLNRYKITLLLAVPRFYSLLQRGIRKKIESSLIASFLFQMALSVKSPSFSKFIFSSVHKRFGGHLRHLICGGAALDTQVESDFITLGFSLLVGYGMSECAPMISFTRPGDIIPQSSGKPLPGLEVHSVDGEIWVKGPNVMLGYWNRPEETEKTMDQGFLKTGDIGHFDSEGRLYITGRKKEIIVLPSGKNINPDEIENKLSRTFPEIEEVAVLMNGKSLHAIFKPSLKELQSKGIHNLQEFFQVTVLDSYNSIVAPYKRIMSFHLQNSSFPRTRLGKLRRHLLNVHRQEEQVIETTEDDSAVMVELKDYLQMIVSRPIFSFQHLEIDLNLDSLDKINLLSFIKNKWNVSIDEVQLASLTRVSDFAEHIEKNQSTDKVESKKATLPSFSNSSRSTFLRIIKSLFNALLWNRVSLKGREHLSSLPAIYIANHLSFFDAAFLITALPFSKVVRMYFLAKQKHLNSFIARWSIRLAHIIPIDVNAGVASSILQMESVLKNGRDLLIFPEGTRSRTGELGEFKKLFAQLSHELSVPVVPIAISGSDRFLPPGRLFPRFWRRVEVSILAPVFPQGKDMMAILQECEGAIRRKVELSK